MTLVAPMRTRLWESSNGSATAVQFRTDTEPMVWLNTNMGWIPIGNTPMDEGEAESFALQISEGYNLEESTPQRAAMMAGYDNNT